MIVSTYEKVAPISKQHQIATPTRKKRGNLIMGIAEVSMWNVNSIQCSRWKQTNDIATIEISNYAMDSISFQVVRTPDGDIVPLNSSSDFRSEDWYLYTSESKAIGSQLIEILKELEEWQANLDIATKWVEPRKWLVRRGQGIDETVWAGLAYLFELRASMCEPRIIEELAKDMKVDIQLAKERIRKLRDKGFLSIAGKGKSAGGEITLAAKAVLVERGMMNA